MSRYEVYVFDNVLVSPINEKEAITQKGDIIPIIKEKLRKSSLLPGGEYNEKFLQVVLGGLVAPPKSTGKYLIYKGKNVIAMVEPVSTNIVRFAIGIPNEAFGPGAERLNDLKINKDKVKDYDKFTDKKPGRPKLKEEGYDGAELPEPEELKIDESENISGVKKLVLEWNSNIGDFSIDDIKEMFGNEGGLPEPDVIKLETETESIVRKRGKNPTVTTAEKDTNGLIKKGGYFGESPVMYQVCPKCQSKVIIDTEENRKTGKVKLMCVKCGYSYVYEGSLPDQGIPGQTKEELIDHGRVNPF